MLILTLRQGIETLRQGIEAVPILGIVTATVRETGRERFGRSAAT